MGEYNTVVMQYLIQTNTEYMHRLKEFEEKVDNIFDLLKVLQYNITELQNTVHTLRTTDAQDTALKEAFNVNRNRQR